MHQLEKASVHDNDGFVFAYTVKFEPYYFLVLRFLDVNDNLFWFHEIEDVYTYLIVTLNVTLI